MIKIKPYKIYANTPYFLFEVKGRGTCFQFYIDENKHLLNVKLVGEEAEINGEAYLIKAIGRVISEDDGTNRQAYSVIVTKVQNTLNQ